MMSRIIPNRIIPNRIIPNRIILGRSALRRMATCLATACFGFVATGHAETWKIDTSHSSVGFSVRHMMVSKVRGTFNDFEGSLEYDAEKPEESQVKVTIQAKSVDTGNANRDDHLRNEDFLDVTRYPTLEFKSTAIDVADDGTAQITGNLTLHGVTREVRIETQKLGEINDPKFGRRVGFEGTTTIDRKDYGVEYNQVMDTGGLAVGNEVEISLAIEAIMEKPAEGDE